MHEFEPMQVLLMWKLVSSPAGMWLSDLPSHMVTPARRQTLVDAGLVELEKQKRERPGKRTVSAQRMMLTDAGWEWLSRHLTTPLPRSNYAADVLQDLLRVLQGHFEREGFALADLFLSHSSSSSDSDENNAVSQTSQEFATEEVERQIERAYAKLAKGQSNARVRLADLRDELLSVSRQQVDQTLKNLQAAGRLVLNRLDDPLQRSDRDEQARITTSLGEPRHLVHMEIASHG